MKRFLFFSFLALLMATKPTFADEIKDSVYFTLDDGVMSKEEMEEEAGYIHDICATDPYQSLYFNCDCVAGAFLLQREKLGPMTPQTDIYQKITKSRSSCANTEEIAGNAYDSCMEHATVFRELKKDNPQYCTCVANKIARDFKKSPILETSHVESITINAMTYCDEPQNRTLKKSAAAD